MEATYVIATSKPWHLDGFMKLKSSSSSNWILVKNNQELADCFHSTSPRYIFFLHWNWMVPTEIVNGSECVCFHMTDVPYGRGGSPLQNLIIRGHKNTKLTALRMTDELDAGPVYYKESLSLDGSAEEIYIRAGELCFELVDKIVNNKPTPIEQTGNVVKFKRRKPYQSEVLEPTTMEEFYDFIRMLDAEGYPKAFINHNNFKIEFSQAKLEDGILEAKVCISLRSNNSE